MVIITLYRLLEAFINNRYNHRTNMDCYCISLSIQLISATFRKGMEIQHEKRGAACFYSRQMKRSSFPIFLAGTISGT